MSDEHHQPIIETQIREAHRIPKDQVSSTAFYQSFLTTNPPPEHLSSFNKQCAQIVQESLSAQNRKTEPSQAFFSLKDGSVFLGLSVKQLVQLEKKGFFPKFEKLDKNPRISAWVLVLHRSVETWRNDQLNIRKVFGNEDHDMQQGSLESLAHYPGQNGFMALWKQAQKRKKD